MAGQRTWRRRASGIGIALAVAGLLAVGLWLLATRWRPSSDAHPLQGVDVSADTGAIDWPTLRAHGADFAYIRATDGSEQRDAAFAANWAGAHAAGLRRGAIHQFSLCRLAADQANRFIVTVPRVSDALPAALAIDERPECGTPPARDVLIDEVARFARIVESHTGKPLLLMIAPAIEAKYDLARALDRPLWATGNYFPPTYFSRPWRMWRANGRRRVDGAQRPLGWDVVAP